MGITYSALYGLSLGGMFVAQKLAQDISGVNMVHMITIMQLIVLTMSFIQSKGEGQNLTKMGWTMFS